jgi:hypothetical protein
MFGHAIADLVRHGVDVDDQLVGSAEAALAFLVDRRGRDGKVVLVHPWESGCDDSPRWDSWCPGGWTATRWKEVKGELVRSLVFDEATRSPVANPSFEVPAAGFNALVAFNIAELASVAGRPLAGELVDFADRFEPVVDDGTGRPSSRVRTSDALLGVLVEPSMADAVFATLRDPSAFGGDHGPPSVHRSEPTFDPTGYWRGSAWPQLTYLFWVAARRAARPDDERWLAERLVAGAAHSGFAEHWDPDRGTGLGARPQSWTGLAAVVALSDR